MNPRRRSRSESERPSKIDSGDRLDRCGRGQAPGPAFLARACNSRNSATATAMVIDCAASRTDRAGIQTRPFHRRRPLCAVLQKAISCYEYDKVLHRHSVTQAIDDSRLDLVNPKPVRPWHAVFWPIWQTREALLARINLAARLTRVTGQALASKSGLSPDRTAMKREESRQKALGLENLAHQEIGR